MTLELTLEPRSSKFDEDHDGWRSHVSDLYRELGREVEGFELRRESVPGTKGAQEVAMIIAASAMALGTASGVILTWVRGDRTRSLRAVRRTASGAEESIEVTSDMSDDVLAAFFGNGSWAPSGPEDGSAREDA